MTSASEVSSKTIVAPAARATCEHGGDVDRPAPQRQVKVHPPDTLIVVKVHVQERRPRVGEPFAERAGEGGMAGIQDDAEALQIEVAGRD